MRAVLFVIGVALLAGIGTARAGDSLRVGTRVLVAGDSAATVVALLGKPSWKAAAHAPRTGTRRRRRAVRVVDAEAGRGERWQYRRDGRVIVVTLVDGRVASIDERTR